MSSQERVIRAVELAIIDTEGLMVVNGTPFTSYIDAELARRTLAERAIAEASILCRYVRLEPPCAECGFNIKPWQASREVDGRLFHDSDEHPCAQAFEDSIGARPHDPVATQCAHDRVRARLDARPITTVS
jgi:hypothetical protein